MIAVESVSKKYGAVTAVCDLSLSIGQGEVVALLGPNGSGKTTTLKSIVGLVRPTSGRILVNGLDTSSRREEALAGVSYLPQRLNFPESLSGMEILSFYARLRDLPPEAIPAAASLVGLEEALQREVREYSGGMVQRLGLAVLSLPDVPVLLLDEPTAGIDPQARRRFKEWLHTQRARRKTILFTTHRLEDAEEFVDRVAILVDGRLVGEMTAAELRARAVIEVWIGISNMSPRYQEISEALGAETLCADERGDYVFAARAGQAVEIMKTLKMEGADIFRFVSRSSLERFYHQTTGEAQNDWNRTEQERTSA